MPNYNYKLNLIGALTSKQYAFKARFWELQKSENIDFSDAFCVNIVLYTKSISNKEILRILPSTQTKYTHNWITDKTRFSFEGLRFHRIENPKIFMKNVYWSDVFLVLKKTLNKISNNTAVVFGNLSDLKTIFILSSFVKYQGGSDIIYETKQLSYNPSFSFFHSSNSLLDSLNDIQLFFVINSNLRYEASLLNTSIRTFKQNKEVTYLSVGNFNVLGFTQIHAGNALLSLMSFLENKSALTKLLYKNEKIFIILGFENLKKNISGFLQNTVRFLSKKTLRQTKTGSFFATLHSNVGSSNFCFLGLQSTNRSGVYNDNLVSSSNNVFTYLQNLNLDYKDFYFKNSNIIALDSHKKSTYMSQMVTLPIKLYFEKQTWNFDVTQTLKKSDQVILNSKKKVNYSFFLYL